MLTNPPKFMIIPMTHPHFPPATDATSAAVRQAPILTVTFDERLSRDEIPLLRGAIVAKVGRELDLFHNHDREGAKLYRYPLIQYKVMHGSPALVCLGAGVESVQAYLNLRDRSLDLDGRQLRMDVADLQVRQHGLRIWQSWFSYRVTDWIALHGPHLEAYRAEPSLGARILQLERKLNSNVRSFTRAMGWTGDGQVEVRIHHLRNAAPVQFKGVQFRAFDVEFSCNVRLPNHIGFGKGSAFGFGVVTNNAHRS